MIEARVARLRLRIAMMLCEYAMEPVLTNVYYRRIKSFILLSYGNHEGKHQPGGS